MRERYLLLRVGIRWTVLVLALWLTACAPKPLVTVSELSAYNGLFDREEGWTGADGVYSVAFPEDKTLWLFGDTWVGKIRDGRHVEATLINNSLAMQQGKDPATATVQFYYRQAVDGHPEPFIRPSDGKSWFWMYDGVLAPDGLYLFLIELERAEPAGFRLTGTWLAQVGNPSDSPLDWRISLKRIPWARFSPSGDLFFGSAILEDGGFFYIYGIDEDVRNGWHHKYMIVARVPKDHLWDLDQWRFHADGAWTSDMCVHHPSLRRNGQRVFGLLFAGAGRIRRGLHGGRDVGPHHGPQGPDALRAMVLPHVALFLPRGRLEPIGHLLCGQGPSVAFF